MKNEKKICYVATIPLTIEAFFVSQLKKLATQYNVTVICSYSSTLQEKLGDNVRYIPLNIPRGISLLGSVPVVFKLIRIMRKEHFDLIQYSTPNAALYSSIAAKIAGVRIRLYHLMGYRYLGAMGGLRKFLKIIEKFTCTLSTHIECVSQSNLRFGISEGLFPPEKVTVVWNGSSGGIDLERFDILKRQQWRNEVRSELKISEHDIVFGFVGRITRDKGINEILEVFSHPRKNVKCLLIGAQEGIPSLDLKLWNEAKSNPSILIHDAVSDIERYYAAIDTLLLPSYREGFGNVIIEAGAMGVPSIVSNIPGPVDAVQDGKTGLICESKNVKALQEAIHNIIDNNLFQKLGNAAYEYVSRQYEEKELNEHVLKRKEMLLGKHGK